MRKVRTKKQARRTWRNALRCTRRYNALSEKGAAKRAVKNYSKWWRRYKERERPAPYSPAWKG